ncbi:nucleolar protein of 40 kDa isoform X2 [Tachyglossus aculeatus]|uniref:nucleolar protein of 40 kDa isoform X2 n=1 Tax=Tachyglossus aculeatus TaxID=9261 RepID=UPI0018F5CEA2|nr:nucleolar protein of 40 kDa isoform X2 [Tachyglossus aculeatus]
MISGRVDGEGSIPDLYSIFRGEVASVKDYGVFVRIPGCRKQGLVHRTHMSSCRVDKPSEMVDVGDTVWVKLIGREEERRKRSFKDFTGQKITLEAVLNTVCKKCGCKGHFAKDCFMQPGGPRYTLVPEEEEEEEEAAGEEPGPGRPDQAPSASKKRKKEKKKKKKKKTHKHQKSSDSESDASPTESRQHKRKKKKHHHKE